MFQLILRVIMFQVDSEVMLGNRKYKRCFSEPLDESIKQYIIINLFNLFDFNEASLAVSNFLL